MSTSGPSLEAVRRWLEDVEDQTLALELEIQPLLQEQARLQARRQLLRELMASFEIPTGPDSQVTLSVVSQPSGRETVRERVHREVVEVLQEVGRPLHINELTAEYVKRGFKVPGQGKPANLSVHLSGWADRAKPEYGIYGLAQFVDQSSGTSVHEETKDAL